MKASIYFLTLAVALILTACSQDSQDLSPVSSQLDKKSTPPKYPYEYLATFPEISIKWEVISEKENIARISLGSKSAKYDHYFCEVEYNSFAGTNVPNKELIFLGKPGETFNLPLADNKVVSNVRVFGVLGYVPSGMFTTQFPYTNLQHFNVVPVIEWTAKDETISVVANNSVVFSQHAFLKIVSKEGTMLVFLGKPATQAFDIPKYGDKNIEELNLYSFNSLSAYDRNK